MSHLRCLFAPLLSLAAACGGEPSEFVSESELGTHEAAVTIPARGTSSTLDFASWNIEWFGSTSNGPTNESLQLSNARDVISGADMDIWGVAEIVDTNHFNNLVSQLSGYAGFLSNASSVQSGSSYYSSSEQKLGLIYKTSVATVLSSRIILTAYDYDFAGRPPLEVQLRVSLNGYTEDIVVIVLHAKAGSDSSSWQRRYNAAAALKSYLDSTWASKKVLVIGDFNDDVDTSITSGKASSYKNFVDDSADYFFPTKALSDAGISSTTSYPDMVDHHLITNEVKAVYVSSSAEAYRVDAYISNYDGTTSDHFPVLTRYTWGSSGTGNVFLNEILANEEGSSTSGEFIELYNAGSASVDLGKWTLSDGGGVRHTFPSGTSLAAGKALVVYGSTASTGTLSLANGGDTVTLKNTSGTVVDSFTYSSSLSGTDGVSMNRSPDASKSGGFVLHTSLSSLKSSAGKRVSGSSF